MKYYRLLNKGEVIKEGDEWFDDANSWRWKDTLFVGEKFDPTVMCPIRRPIKKWEE